MRKKVSFFLITTLARHYQIIKDSLPSAGEWYHMVHGDAICRKNPAAVPTDISISCYNPPTHFSTRRSVIAPIERMVELHIYPNIPDARNGPNYQGPFASHI